MNFSANFSFAANQTVNDDVTHESENETSRDEWPYFDLYGREYWSIVLTIAVIGIEGNVMQFVLMTDSKLSYLSYSVYLKFLSVSDSLLLSGVLLEEAETFYELDSVIDINNALCKTLNSFRFSTKLLSPWLVVGLTLDRYVCVCFPMTRERFCTRTKATAICTCAVVVALALVVPVLTVMEIQEGYCKAPLYLQYYFLFVRLLVSSTLPCLFILVLNVLIIIRIQKSRTFRQSFARPELTNEKHDNSSRPLVLLSALAFVTITLVALAECAVSVLKLTDLDRRALKLTRKLWPALNVMYLLNFGQNFYILIGKRFELQRHNQNEVFLLRDGVESKEAEDACLFHRKQDRYAKSVGLGCLN